MGTSVQSNVGEIVSPSPITWVFHPIPSLPLAHVWKTTSFIKLQLSVDTWWTTAVQSWVVAQVSLHFSRSKVRLEMAVEPVSWLQSTDWNGVHTVGSNSDTFILMPPPHIWSSSPGHWLVHSSGLSELNGGPMFPQKQAVEL